MLVDCVLMEQCEHVIDVLMEQRARVRRGTHNSQRWSRVHRR